MMIVLYMVVILAFFYANYYRGHRTLHMLQQNLYNENNRYLKWLSKNITEFFSLDIIVIAINLIGIFVIFDLNLYTIIAMIIMTLLLCAIGYRAHNIIVNDQNKKKLVVTARIKRLIFTSSIIYLVPLVILGLNIDNSYIVWLIFK